MRSGCARAALGLQFIRGSHVRLARPLPALPITHAAAASSNRPTPANEAMTSVPRDLATPEERHYSRDRVHSVQRPRPRPRHNAALCPREERVGEDEGARRRRERKERREEGKETEGEGKGYRRGREERERERGRACVCPRACVLACACMRARACV